MRLRDEWFAVQDILARENNIARNVDAGELRLRVAYQLGCGYRMVPDKKELRYGKIV